MAVTILYTDTDAIRATIGLDDSDVEDTVLTTQFLDLQMTRELDKFYPTHSTDFFAIPTVADQLKLWCTYFGALRLAESPLAAPFKLGTGKDEFTRFPMDWDALKMDLKAKLAEIQEDLTPATTTGHTLFSKSTPASDPIDNT